MKSLYRNPASELVALAAMAPVSVTAGGAGDNVAVNGYAIDLNALPRAEAILFSFAGRATLAGGQTATVSAKVQTSSDGTTFVDLPEQAKNDNKSAVVAASGDVVLMVDASFEYCARYVRVVLTPDLSATGTDTMSLSCVAHLAGVHRFTAI